MCVCGGGCVLLVSSIPPHQPLDLPHYSVHTQAAPESASLYHLYQKIYQALKVKIRGLSSSGVFYSSPSAPRPPPLLCPHTGGARVCQPVPPLSEDLPSSQGKNPRVVFFWYLLFLPISPSTSPTTLSTPRRRPRLPACTTSIRRFTKLSR